MRCDRLLTSAVAAGVDMTAVVVTTYTAASPNIYLITGQAGPEVERKGRRWRRSRDAGRRADASLRRPIVYSRLGLEAGLGPQPGFPFASCSAPPLTSPAGPPPPAIGS